MLVMVAACGGDDGTGLVLDGRPFEPDASGVVDDVDEERLVLDGETYELADEIAVFSASTLERIPLVGRRGQYVQIGLDDERVVWVAAVGGVLRTDPPVVLFEDRIVSVDGSARFQGGLVLDVAPDVELPNDETVRVRIDPVADEIIGISP